MPRESIALVLTLGLSGGMLWGLLSYEIWKYDERASVALLAPVYATMLLTQQTGTNPLVVGAAICGGVGVLASAVLLLFMRLRGA